MHNNYDEITMCMCMHTYNMHGTGKVDPSYPSWHPSWHPSLLLIRVREVWIEGSGLYHVPYSIIIILAIVPVLQHFHLILGHFH